MTKHHLSSKLKVAHFLVMLFGYWLLHILLIGWISYLFFPKTYIIRAGNISEDLERSAFNNHLHQFWWNRFNCDAAVKAICLNDSNNIVRFTERTHPFFLDSTVFYVNSPGYRARWIDDKEKIYPTMQ